MAYDKTKFLIPREDYEYEIARGNVIDMSTGIKFGRNDEVGTVRENINDLGGQYTYSTAVVPYYISSSSGSDIDQVITVVGIGANNEEVSQTISLAGQTKTTLTTDLFRVYRVYVQSGSDLVGDVYIYENDTVTAGVPQTASLMRAKILIGNNQTQMAQLTIPDNHRILITDFLMTSGKDNVVQYIVRLRPSDASAPWRVIFDHDSYRVALNMSTQIPWVIPENMDIEITAKAVSGTKTVACMFSYVMEKINNEQV